MTVTTVSKACSEASLTEHLVWRAKCGLQSRMHTQHRDCKRLRQDLHSTDAPCLVVSGLYLGSKDSEQDKGSLLELGVTHILQVGVELKPSHPDEFEYKSLDLYDLPQEDIVSQFSVCFDFIQAALTKGSNILVHCAAGVSRSACVAIGYLMWKQSLSLREAKDVVENARPIIQLNMGFYLQLRQFEQMECKLQEWPGWTLASLAQSRAAPKSKPTRAMSAPLLSASA